MSINGHVVGTIGYGEPSSFVSENALVGMSIQGIATQQDMSSAKEVQIAELRDRALAERRQCFFSRLIVPSRIFIGTVDDQIALDRIKTN